MLRRERLSTHTQRVRQDVSDFYSNETGRFLKPGRALILHTRGFLKPGRGLIPHTRGVFKARKGFDTASGFFKAPKGFDTAYKGWGRGVSAPFYFGFSRVSS